MKHTKKIILASTLLAIAGTVAARSMESNEISTQATYAKITIAQATNIAETSLNGKAKDAELESHKGQMAYDIEVVDAAGKVYDVIVNADNGTIISAAEDTNDKDGNDKADNDQNDNEKDEGADAKI